MESSAVVLATTCGSDGVTTQKPAAVATSFQMVMGSGRAGWRSVPDVIRVC